MKKYGRNTLDYCCVMQRRFLAVAVGILVGMSVLSVHVAQALERDAQGYVITDSGNYTHIGMFITAWENGRMEIVSSHGADDTLRYDVYTLWALLQGGWGPEYSYSATAVDLTRGGVKLIQGAGTNLSLYANQKCNLDTYLYVRMKLALQNEGGALVNFGWAEFWPRIYVNFDAQGGNGAPAKQVKYIGSKLALPTQKPQKTGYTFKGWSLTPGGGVDIAPGQVIGYDDWNLVSRMRVSTAGVARDEYYRWIANPQINQASESDKKDPKHQTIILYAVYEPNNYTISFGGDSKVTGFEIWKNGKNLGRNTKFSARDAHMGDVYEFKNVSFANDYHFLNYTNTVHTAGAAVSVSDAGGGRKNFKIVMGPGNETVGVTTAQNTHIISVDADGNTFGSSALAGGHVMSFEAYVNGARVNTVVGTQAAAGAQKTEAGDFWYNLARAGNKVELKNIVYRQGWTYARAVPRGVKNFKANAEGTNISFTTQAEDAYINIETLSSMSLPQAGSFGMHFEQLMVGGGGLFAGVGLVLGIRSRNKNKVT